MARPDRLRSFGDRFEQLLQPDSQGGPVARHDVKELVRLLVELYGAGLERVLELADESGALDDVLLERLADDDLIASLLLVHGLHPYTVHERVERALAKVRPYLGSHGGDVELLEVTAEGAVRLRMLGSCDGCPSSSATLELAVRTAIETAAPETTTIDVEGAAAAVAGNVIPVETLTARLHTAAAEPASSAWEQVAGLGVLPPGAVRCMRLSGVNVLLCRLGATYYAYRDQCPGCGAGFAGAAVERRLGASAGTGVLTCPTCRSHFDVARAGRSLGDEAVHLDPLPLLERGGVVEIALPVGVTA
jgi:Fe-S cluster biogenesis protein NfuA/nitrite reductase/ring-hydroxylating ferredoxin subunit